MMQSEDIVRNGGRQGSLSRTPTVLTQGGKRKPSHQMMQEMSESMIKQNKTLIRELKGMSKGIGDMSNSSKINARTSERIHDRLDSLIVEQRTTNILLSQLVSMHSSVMMEDTLGRIDREKQAETIRMVAYDRVLRGE